MRVTGGFGEGERYHITHPIASVNGILRGSFYVTVGESTIISVSGGKPGQRLGRLLSIRRRCVFPSCPSSGCVNNWLM